MSSYVRAQDRLRYAFETYRTRRDVCARDVRNPSARAASVMITIANNCDVSRGNNVTLKLPSMCGLGKRTREGARRGVGRR
jgi:hypothetical protein